MVTNDELASVHGFLRATGEGNLRKMLVQGKMTDVHLRVLLKVARQCTEAEFVTHALAQSFPKVKFGPPETAIKESFWGVTFGALSGVGLIGNTTQAKKAA